MPINHSLYLFLGEQFWVKIDRGDDHAVHHLVWYKYSWHEIFPPYMGQDSGTSSHPFPIVFHRGAVSGHVARWRTFKPRSGSALPRHWRFWRIHWSGCWQGRRPLQQFTSWTYCKCLINPTNSHRDIYSKSSKYRCTVSLVNFCPIWQPPPHFDWSQIL